MSRKLYVNTAYVREQIEALVTQTEQEQPSFRMWVRKSGNDMVPVATMILKVLMEGRIYAFTRDTVMKLEGIPADPIRRSIAVNFLLSISALDKIRVQVRLCPCQRSEPETISVYTIKLKRAKTRTA